MAWYPRAQRFELQPESRDQPAIVPQQFIMHSIAAPWSPERTYEYWQTVNLESHFGLGFDGSIGQYLSTETKADANYRANARAVSIETASNTDHTDPWTDAQVGELIRLGVWLHREHGIPLRICRTWDDPGFGYHRMFPEWSTGGTECPGDARVGQFHTVVFPGIVAHATDDPMQEDEVTPEDIKAIAAAVWNHPVPIPRLQPDSTIKHEGPQAALWPLVWGNVWAVEAQRRDAALQAAVTSLAGLLSAQHTNLTAEQITAAVRAGIADGVHVDVDVAVRDATGGEG